jgi:hypothetical protein
VQKRAPPRPSPSEISTIRTTKLSKSPYAFRLLEKLGTDPKVYYLSTREWVRKMADNYRPDQLQPVGVKKV